MLKQVAERRAFRKWSQKEIAGRVLWSCVSPLFRWSPRPFWGWRCSLLRCFGARLGRGVNIYPSCRITIPWHLEIDDWSTIGDGVILYALGTINIGASVTVSQGAHICAGSHDYENPKFSLLKLPITIQDSAWVCADAFVGPNVTIGEGAVVAARAVVVKDIASWEVVGGNPCKRIKSRMKQSHS